MSAHHEPDGPATARSLLRDILPLVEAVPVAGPPAILLAGPWILLALVLAGPIALLLTIVLALAVAAGIIFALGAIPYLLVRHLRAAVARHASAREQVERHPATAPAPTSISLPGY